MKSELIFFVFLFEKFLKFLLGILKSPTEERTRGKFFVIFLIIVTLTGFSKNIMNGKYSIFDFTAQYFNFI